MTVLAIVLGAAIGAPLRYLLDRWVTGRTAGPGWSGEVPWGLFAVNILGSAAAAVAATTLTGTARTLVLTGVCGAFTTFSGFSWEGRRLWAVTRGAFWVTVIGMPLLCVTAFVVVVTVAHPN